MTGYVRVTNDSGELYNNAQTRLVVGTVNLVEKIADLARRPPPGKWRKLKEADRLGLQKDFDEAARKGEEVAFGAGAKAESGPRGERQKQVVKQGLSEYFLFTIEGAQEHQGPGGPEATGRPQGGRRAAGVRLQALRRRRRPTVHRDYRFRNVKLLDQLGEEKKLSAMENLGLSPLPNGTVRLFSEYRNQDLAHVGSTETKYVPIGNRVEVNVGPDKDITIFRRLKDQKIANVVARQYKRRLDDKFVLYYDLIDYDETFSYEEELVSGKPVVAKAEVQRQFDANVVLWGEGQPPKDSATTSPGPTSICTRFPVGSSVRTSGASSISSISSPARNKWSPTASPTSGAKSGRS